MPLSVGTRVVRGPDWQWGDQDEGEGHVGTVVSVGKGISNPAHPKLVVVLWDMGRKADYRAGFDNKYDLLTFDNATTGVKHNGVICDDCKEADIAGIRWKCSTCNDYDLCNKCYMAGKHDVRHRFLRVIAPKSVGHLMPPRANSKIIRARGLFPGATVGRGLDWKWSEQDGGLGKTGVAVKQRNWANSGRSALVVRWNAGGSYEYRVGHDGKVDLKCLKAADGGPYYKEHLPKFGEVNTLEEGDRVVVNLDKGIVQQLQENHGGWVSKMEKYLGKVGKLAHIYPTGDLKIRYSDSQTWTFSPTCVTKLQTFKAGDKVRILSDQSKVKALQVFHGGWAEGMSRAIGKEGRVLFLDADGDVKVNVGGTFWTFNPDCLIPAEQEHGVDGLFEQSGDEAVVQLLKQLLDPLGLVDSEVFRGVTTAALSKMIFEAAAKGDFGEVRELITRDKSLVNVEVQGNRPLDVASYKGHLAVVDLLVKNGAKLDVKDKDGDTALCNAVYQNETKIVEYLLKKGAKANIVNNSMRSALHIAVAKNGTDCVKLLLQYGCDPNLKDKVGDTALHDAIRKKVNDIIELLVSAKKSDLTVTNKKGFNPLHFAARLDNAFATRKVLAKKRSLVDIRKEDGYSALHLAALSDHRNIVQILVTEGQCAIDLYNDEHQTALVLAILHGRPLVVEDLVDHGADVNTCDGDGDTCLHLAIMKHRQGQGVPDTQVLRKFRHKYRDNGITTPLTALMCYLVQQGADVEKTNLKKRTPLSYLKEVAIRKVLEHIARKRERPESGDSSMLEVGKAAGSGGGGGGNDEFGNQTGEGLPQPQSPVQATHCVHKIEDPDKDLEQGEVIGRGGFGEVRKGRWRGTEVAIKIMCSEGSRQDVVESEVSIHKRAIHPNIVQLMAVGHKLNQAVLVMQLIRGKNLMNIIFEDGNPLSFEQRVRVSSELLSAVTYLHHCKILHLDIKPGNVILEAATSRPYLCDLGLAHIKTRSAMSSTLIGARGTPRYMSPEAICPDERGNMMKVTSASDVWSLAGTLLELFTGKPLWPPMNQYALVGKFMRGDVTPSEVKGKNLDDRVKAMISPCFQKDPKDRPTADILMQGFSGLA